MRSLVDHVCSFSGVCLVVSSLVACEGVVEEQQTFADGGPPPFDGGECQDCGSQQAGPEAGDTPFDGGPSDSGGGGREPEIDAAMDGVDAGQSEPGDGDSATREHPADLLDLTDWKLTVPVETEHAGNPDEYKNPELQTLTLEPYFMLSPSRDAVVFRAHAGGATTVNSRYPRSELREMTLGGSELASWSTSSGVHRMRVRQAITQLTPVKPHVVAAQIHDANDDVVMVRLEDKHLYVEGNNERLGTLDTNYELGTVFTIEIVAAHDTIEVFYNGALKATLQRTAAGCYFKVGCYTQSNVDRGEVPEDYAQVVVYELKVTHEL